MKTRFSGGSTPRYDPPVARNFSAQSNPKFERARRLGAIVVEPAPVAPSVTGPFVFTHLPKTGGLTLRSIVKAIALISGQTFLEVFGGPRLGPDGSIENYREVVDRRYREAHFVAGHLPFGLHPGNHLVLMRDPVERALSTYGFMVERSVVKLGTPISQLFESGVLRDNMQTRLMSGRLDLLDPKVPCSDGVLGLALLNLMDYVLAADLVCFNDMLAMLLAILRAPPVIYFRRNVTAVDLPLDLTEEIRVEVRRRLRFDIALFEAVRGRARSALPVLPAALPAPSGCLAFNDPNADYVVHYEDRGEEHIEALKAAGIPVCFHRWQRVSAAA